MRLTCFTILLLAITAGCKDDKSAQTTPPKPTTPATPTPPPIASTKGTRGPNSDKTAILGKWNATKGADAMQFEFTPTNLTIRQGPGLKDAKTVQYTMRNELSPSQLDWGTAADGGFGLYALDGDNLYIDYLTGGPENRPKKLGKPTTAKQLEFQRVK